MEFKEGSRARNNKIIFITSGIIVLLTLFSLQNKPLGKVVVVSVGDDSFQVANMLSKEGVPFTALAGEAGEGVVVAYTPLSAWSRLHKKRLGSRYDIRFGEGQVAEIIWRDRHGKELGSLLFVKVVGRP